MDTARVDDEVLASICHDLRGPLASILMGTSFVLRTLPDDENAVRTRRVVEAMRRSAERMNRLVSDYQELARLERGLLDLDLAEHDVAELLGDVAAMHKPEAERAGIRLRVRPGEAHVRCDRERITRAVSELVLNSLHATEAGGEVTLSVEAQGDEVVACVADTGRGVDPEILPHVFDYRWLASRRTRDGAGLGLGVARGVVEAHGGRLALVSRQHEGTTVTIALPNALSAVASPA